jgi:hypothetical protein
MPLTLALIQAQFNAGESEGALLSKLQTISKETFEMRKEQNGSPTARASMTRKYLGSKGSKVVLHVDPKSGKVYGVATTAEGL